MNLLLGLYISVHLLSYRGIAHKYLAVVDRCARGKPCDRSYMGGGDMSCNPKFLSVQKGSESILSSNMATKRRRVSENLMGCLEGSSVAAMHRISERLLPLELRGEVMPNLRTLQNHASKVLKDVGTSIQVDMSDGSMFSWTVARNACHIWYQKAPGCTY